MKTERPKPSRRARRGPLVVLAASALLLGARPVGAADTIATIDGFLPIVHIVGATGVFRTDLEIFNPDSVTAVIDLYYAEHETDGTQSLVVRVTLPSRQSISLPDILLANFGISAGYGLLEFRSNVPVIVTSNTYNVAGAVAGTYGQFSPAQPFRKALPFAASPNEIFGDLYAVGLRNASNLRTNAVILNPTRFTLDAGVELVDRFGVFLGKKRYSVPPFSLRQLNDVFGAEFASFGPPSGAGYRLTFYVNSRASGEDPRILAYVTITDRNTGDPYLVTGEPVLQ